MVAVICASQQGILFVNTIVDDEEIVVLRVKKIDISSSRVLISPYMDRTYPGKQVLVNQMPSAFLCC